MEKMTVEQIATEIEGIDGFSYDWTSAFSETIEDAERRAGEDAEPKVYYTEGPGGWENIPETAEDAKKTAKRYEERVLESSREAAEYEAKAVKEIRAGNLPAALDALKNAARCEKEYGDDPTYSHLVEQLSARV